MIPARVFPLFMLGLIVWVKSALPDIQPDCSGKIKIGEIRILDCRYLTYGQIGREKFSEISDLAYSVSNKMLYMIGDEGELFSFYVKFGRKIEKIESLGAYRISGKDGEKLPHKLRDAEGLTITDNGKMFVSFERKVRITELEKDGSIGRKLIMSSRLGKDIKMVKNTNNTLESITWHPEYGLITALEHPPEKFSKKERTLYSLKGKEWHFLIDNGMKSSITSLEAMKDGNILVLERSYGNETNPFVITLRKIYIDRCGKFCQSKVLARFDTLGNKMAENFEGLARVANDRYVIISDDNDDEKLKTEIVYFEIVED